MRVDDIQRPSLNVQYKGTSLCADFWCTCGKQGHIDDDFCYAIECGFCGSVWVLPTTLRLIPIDMADFKPDPAVYVQMDPD